MFAPGEDFQGDLHVGLAEQIAEPGNL